MLMSQSLLFILNAAAGDNVRIPLHDYVGFGMPRSASALSRARQPPSARRGTCQPLVTPPKERVPIPISVSGGQGGEEGMALSRGRLVLSPEQLARATRGVPGISHG